MSFIWPVMLILLVLIPLGVVFYVRMQRRRQQLAARAGSMGLLQQAAAGQYGVRRHIPPALFAIALTLLVISLARPQTAVSLPRLEGTVILAFDVSGSMAAEDMQPTRMEAAKAAAKEFVLRQPASVQVGIVAFSESGLTVQVPTNDQAKLLATINRLAPSRGTSLANGIEVALDTIAAQGQETHFYSGAAGSTPTPTPTPTPVPKGTFKAASIVLLTDGENTVQPDPMEAAQLAVDRGVRIHTIGIGSPAGANLTIEGFTIHTQLDEDTLKSISQLTNGSYYNAQTEQDLLKIYQTLGTELVVKPQQTEVTSLVAGAGLVVLLISGLLTMLWFSRLP